MTTAACLKLELPTAPKENTITRRSWLAVSLLFAIIYLGSAFTPALQDDADSTHAEAAREMYMTGDYITLHVNGVRYLEKAPLMYWLLALSYRLFGVNEFATRLPTMLAMFLLVVLAMRWGQRAFGPRAGIYAGLFLSTAAGSYLFTRILIPDAILSLLIAATFYFFLTGLHNPGLSWRWYAGYGSLALAVLTKGLVAVVFVGITTLAYLLVTGDWRRWREFHLPTGLLLFVAITAPWHVLAGIQNPRFFWFYFVNEHFLRFLGRRYPNDYNKIPAALYWSLHVVWLFPWSLYLPIALKNLRREFRAVNPLRDPAYAQTPFGIRTRLLCWLWASVVLTFFAFSTSQEYYTFPAYLPMLLLIAGAMAREEFSVERRWLVSSAALTAVISIAAAGILMTGLWSSRNLPFVPDISTVLAKHNLSQDTLSMSHILDLTGESFAALRLPAVLATFALLFGPTIALWLRARRKHFSATWATAITMALFLVAAHIALGRFDSYLSSKNLAELVAHQSRPGDQIAIYGDQAFGSSLLFYLKPPIYLVNGRTTSMWFGSTYPDAPKIFLDDSELLRRWNSPIRLFLFVPPHERARVDSLLGDHRFLVGESSGKVIYGNRL